MTGYVQVYTGDGKGKTTAALGLALRAVGAGLRVFCAQFVKGADYNEIKAIRQYLPLITLKQYGRGCFLTGQPSPEDIAAAQVALQEIKWAMLSGSYDIIILDEANIATHFNLIKVADLVDLIRQKPPQIELIITGRRAAPEVIALADLVTEMKEIKHYYQHGIPARPGIEY